jgi:thioredoxin 1
MAASPNVQDFTDGNFESEVLSSSVPVLVDFWAEWCGPCRAMSPTIDAVADGLVGKAKVGKVNIDDNRAIAMKYNITAIPTIMIFKGGQKVKTLVGMKKKDELTAALEEAANA